MPSSLALGCWSRAAAIGFEGEDVAPGDFDGMDRGAAAFHHLFHPCAEEAVDADEDFVARLDQIGGQALHARHAGAAEREGERVLGAEHLPQQFAGLVQDGEILRVEVAEGRRGEGAQRPVAGPGWGRRQGGYVQQD